MGFSAAEATNAHNAFLTSSNSFQLSFSALSSSLLPFVHLAQSLEEKAKDLELKEYEMKVLEEAIANKSIQVDETTTKREQELERRERELEKKEKEIQRQANLVLEIENRWNETQKRMEANAASLPTLVQLSVGGQRFTVPKSLLLKHTASLFHTMLTTDYAQQINGEFYIDYSPKHFQTILDFLRNENIDIDCVKKSGLRECFEFFSLPFPSVSSLSPPPPPPPPPPPDSAPPPLPLHSPSTSSLPHAPPLTVSSHRHHNKQHLIKSKRPEAKPKVPTVPLLPVILEGGSLVPLGLQNYIKTWLPNHTFLLLFKASRDGFNQGVLQRWSGMPLITIIQSEPNKYLFGYYLQANSHQDSFLFTLTNPHNIPPTKYEIRELGFFQALLGAYCDISMDFTNLEKQLCCNFPRNYADTTGKGKRTFAGDDEKLFDVELYCCERATK